MYFVTAKLNLDIPGEYSNYSNSYIKINEILLTFFIHAVQKQDDDAENANWNNNCHNDCREVQVIFVVENNIL